MVTVITFITMITLVTIIIFITKILSVFTVNMFTLVQWLPCLPMLLACYGYANTPEGIRSAGISYLFYCSPLHSKFGDSLFDVFPFQACFLCVSGLLFLHKTFSTHLYTSSGKCFIFMSGGVAL
jgi:hypothetical protein